MRTPTVWLGLSAAVAACVHPNSVPRTDQLFVRGKAYECVDAAKPLSAVATGKTVQLVVGQQVLDEDVVGPDGSFVLHPKRDAEVTGQVFIVAGKNRVSLANDYASWMQNNLTAQVTLTFSCAEEAPSTQREERPASPAPALRPPSPRLTPR